MPSLRDLGARVRRARMRLPIIPTQAQAGELIDRSRRWWQELEAGRLDPQLGDLERVADLLGLELGELLAIGRMTPEDRAARPEHRAALAEQPPDGDDVNRR